MEWRRIYEFPMYEVSEFGNVRRGDTKREMKPKWDKNGWEVKLKQKRWTRHVRVGGLVLKAFKGGSRQGKNVRYVDGDRDNLHYTNLRFVPNGSLSYEVCGKGIDNISTKFNREEVTRIIDMHNGGMHWTEIAGKMGCWPQTIVNILDRKTYKGFYKKIRRPRERKPWHGKGFKVERGEANRFAKLKEYQVIEIMYRKGEDRNEVGKDYGVGGSLIGYIWRGKYWRVTVEAHLVEKMEIEVGDDYPRAADVFCECRGNGRLDKGWWWYFEQDGKGYGLKKEYVGGKFYIGNQVKNFKDYEYDEKRQEKKKERVRNEGPLRLGRRNVSAWWYR